MPTLLRSIPNAFLIRVAAVVVAGLAPACLAAQSVDLWVAPPSASSEHRSSEPPLRIAESFGVEPLARLAEAPVSARDQLEAVEQWNASGGRPMRDGFVRPLPMPRRVAFPESVLSTPAGLHAGGALVRHKADTLVWGAEIRVEAAYRLRAHLKDVHLPANAQLWVYGETGEAVGPFGRELLGPGGLWTPSVGGPVLRIEAEIPRQVAGGWAARFTVDSVAELLHLESDGSPEGIARPKGTVDTSCLIDVTCVSEGDFSIIRLVERAIGHMHFVAGQFTGRCSGGLLNDIESTGTPFFLTANHCLSTQASATSLEVFWDFFTDTCFGSFPTHPSRPRSNGSTLLATGKSSDFTFLQLLDIPGDRAFLGWNASPSALSLGTVLHRVSTPAPNGTEFPQAYSTQRVEKPNPSPCAGGAGEPPVHDQTKFFYSSKLDGGTFGGSSGSPVITADGQTVGQLLGSCGPPELEGEGCHPTPFLLDGAFAETFKFISGFLQGGSGDPQPPGGPWLSTAALPGFEAKLRIGGSTPGSKESECIPESLCVSGALAGRPEIFIKVIGPRPNGFLWTQLSRFTPSRVEVWLRQIATSQINYYELNAVPASSDNVSGLQDREAFSP